MLVRQEIGSKMLDYAEYRGGMLSDDHSEAASEEVIIDDPVLHEHVLMNKNEPQTISHAKPV